MFVISDVLWYVLITVICTFVVSGVLSYSWIICKFISGVLLLHYVLINCDLRLSSQVYCGTFWLTVIYVFCLRCTVLWFGCLSFPVCYRCFDCDLCLFLRGTVVFWLWFDCLLFPVCYRCFDYLWFVCSSSQVYWTHCD